MKQELIALLPEHLRQQLLWFDTVDSTNTQAKHLAAQGAPSGTVLIAEHQTGGRGRLGRSFSSPAGMGIYMSVILRFRCPPQELMHLTCAAAVAACDAVQQQTGIRPGIKWTNDLVCGSRKLAGILTELVLLPQECCAVIGIGMNCCQKPEDFPPELQDMACSLFSLTGQPIPRAQMAARLAEALTGLEHRLFTEKQQLLHTYREDCITVGRDICLVRGDQLRYGHAEGIDDEGALLVRFPDGHLEAVSSGEVSVRGMYGYIC